MSKHDDLRHAVVDHLWDRLEAEGVNPSKDLSEGFWEWYESNIEDPLKELLCEVDGHRPQRDHCGRPEHDHCVICQTLMPGQGA